MSSKGKILFVDDDPLNHDYYKRILELDGFEVVTAFDRAEANSIMDKQEFDIILIDLVLKNESGLDILEDIKKSSRLKYSVVVLISATLISSGHQAYGLDKGASGYITRPINKNEFVSRINAFMRHRELVLKVKKSEEKLLTIVENDPDAILVVDKGGEIKFANKSAENIFQLSVDTLLQNVFGYPVIVGENAEINIVRRDKNRIIGEMRTVNIEWNDENTFLTSIRDITDKKILWESLVKAKNKAEENNRLKSAFLANMSHEIRTPMNGILGFIDILDSNNLTTDEKNLYIDIIKKSGNRLINTINDIISISKLDAGLVKIKTSICDIVEQVDYIVKFFQPESAGKNIKLIFNNQLSERLLVYTDNEKLYSILTNLVKNAIKYTENGSIEIGLSLKTDAEILFYVKDTGSGIPVDRQQAIFERFVQADIEDKQALEGSGLGLAISKEYVEMLGGKIWMESKPNEGSTFYFTISKNKFSGKIEEEEPVIQKKNNVHKPTVLIAEDDYVSQLLYSKILNNSCKSIIQVENGLDAVKKVKEMPQIDIVIMDIKMPIMGGYEALKEIRKFNKDIVIIAQTAYGFEQDKEQALSKGFNDYISKPVNSEEFISKINKFTP